MITLWLVHIGRGRGRGIVPLIAIFYDVRALVFSRVLENIFSARPCIEEKWVQVRYRFWGPGAGSNLNRKLEVSQHQHNHRLEAAEGHILMMSEDICNSSTPFPCRKGRPISLPFPSEKILTSVQDVKNENCSSFLD